jgi:hypothetical protein
MLDSLLVDKDFLQHDVPATPIHAKNEDENQDFFEEEVPDYQQRHHQPYDIISAKTNVMQNVAHLHGTIVAVRFY